MARAKGNPVIRYLKGTRAELKKVNWPSREEVIRLAMIVLAVTAFMAALLGLVDYIFARLFDLIIR